MSQKYKRGNVLSCTMKKPVDLYAKSSDGKDKASCGVSVVDITFPNFEFVDIGDITFKNNYTGFISIKLRSNKDGNQGDPKWLTCIKLTQLMPDVHCDVSSQDYYTFTRDQMLVLPDKVTALRLVLQQPSTVWANFGVDNVTITEYNEERVTIPPMVEWLEKHQHKLAQTPRSDSKSLMPVDEIAAGLQRLWALTAKVQENQTESALGRFDVDGSYEVNLLSYT
ncbi:nicolin-1 [Strongylocentrotus purpuratus]|uniref:Nicolin-1 n=1 Tax=Strongylocentrotus purpuratus TaxID=7668 RepID=A0A7M7N0U9_STRPU|nr:nicolin-1 [Strongylocentrotus purpuratus]